MAVAQERDAPAAEPTTPIDPLNRLVLLARVCEAAGRFDDMRKYMKERVLDGRPLIQPEDRDLLSTAYKSSIDPRREAHVTACISLEDAKAHGCLHEASLAQVFVDNLHTETCDICNDLIGLIGDVLLPKTSEAGGEPRVFYMKVMGDCHRYVAELSNGMAREKAMERAVTSYNDALHLAQNTLLYTHPVRLGLALNMSVFYHEIVRDPVTSIKIASSALASCLQSLEGMPEIVYQETAPFIRALSENLCDWKGEKPA